MRASPREIAVSTPPSDASSISGVSAIPKSYRPDIEIGVTGLKHSWGLLQEEWLQELSGDSGTRVYREMVDNDSTVGAILLLIELLIRNAQWDVSPASQSDEDVEKADFLRSCLFDLDRPWTEFLSESMAMLPYGFSLAEKVYKVRGGRRGQVASKHDDGRIGWAKLAPRHPDTIYRWLLDSHGNIFGAEQWAPPDWKLITLPYQKLVHFRLSGSKNNPAGRSILRNAYRPYLFRKRIEEVEGIGIERELAGLPVIEAPWEWMTASATAEQRAVVSTLKEIVKRVKADRSAGLLVPSLYDNNGNKMISFSLMSASGGRAIDTVAVKAGYRQDIAISMLADFIVLGHDRVGSFALAESKTDFFALAIGAAMDSIVGPLNDSAVPELFELNGITEGPYPTIEHGDVETPDLAALGAFIQATSSAGALTLPDEEIERYVRKAANLPTGDKGSV